MWVITNATTGYEIDRVETTQERDNLIFELEKVDYYEYGYTYRWEI